jgi:DNA mismatch repair protein MutL
MPTKIQILPEHISQAIAAGEVVERPASVVKELIENAIDAGSTEVIVELEAGGLQRIRVCDNGEGMDHEDVPLALQRHATSKIRKVEDLFAIHTLGFRGEALPSIASVAQMTVKTRVLHSVSGTKVICEGGEIKGISEVGCPIGTEVEVRNIFYNLPVKRKFLRSIRSELRYALSHFLRLSLSHPAISFKLIHDGRVLHDLVKTESSMVRIEAILGREAYHHLRPIEFEDGEIKISGFASLPSLVKGNADGIYLFVNGRFVKDRMIHKAIMEIYRHVIPTGKFPMVILFIILPPFLIDVNVHPTKTEIKFRDQERVFHTVIRALRSVRDRVQSLVGTQVESNEKKLEPPKSTFISPSVLKPYPVEFAATDWDEGKSVPMVTEGDHPQWRVEKKIPYRIVGQFQGTYILCEGEKGLILIDQHAAHERILFEEFKNKCETRSVPSERFLIPILMELPSEESFILSSHLEEFESMGFEIDPIGEKSYAIRSIPSFANQKDPKEIVLKILDELSFLIREGKTAEPIQTMLVSLACHAAIRGNSPLKSEEIEELMKTLSPFGLSATCPHGRPIFFVLSLEEIKKQFKRK